MGEVLILTYLQKVIISISNNSFNFTAYHGANA
jgi:hypothetical protein